jgi:mRNA interferase RelE/StbE
MKFDFSHSAIKTLQGLDSTTAGRIIKGIMGLPAKGQIKPLEGELSGNFRLRIGDWRITYAITENVIQIKEITPRGGAYR